MARPRVKIDIAELEKLYGMQCTDEEVAAFVGVSTRTLARRKEVSKFAEVIDRAKARGRVSVRRALFRLAAAGNIAAAIFLAKNLLGYKDILSNEHSGPDGTPIQFANKPDYSQLSMKNLNSFESLLRRPGLLIEIDAEWAVRSLREFVRQAWVIVEPSTPFVPGFHIDAIIEHLEAVTRGQIRNLLINVPPRHMKSLLVSVFWPAWEWLIHPERRWLYSSYAASLSIRDSVKFRRLIESPWYQSRWGDRFDLTSDQNTKVRVDNSRSGYRIATSVGGSATGEGGDPIVCDDPHNVQEVESDTVRKGTLDWWDIVMCTRINNPKTAAMIVIMQRCHQQDLSGHLLEQGGWEHLCLPAEFEGPAHATSIGFSDPRTTIGELLWKERFGPQEIADLKRRLGSYAAAGQLQQRPSPLGGGIFKRHWWRYWQPPGANLPPVVVQLPDGTYQSIHPIYRPTRGVEQIQSWDCSFKDLVTSDYVVGQVWGRVGADYFLGDQVRDRMDGPTTVKAVRKLSERYPGSLAKMIEDKANGSAIISMLKHEIEGILAVNPEGGKESRAMAVSPLIEAGNVYLPHPLIAPWVNDFIEECAAFPNGAHDDQVDACTQTLLRWNMIPRQPVVCVSEYEYEQFSQISPI